MDTICKLRFIKLDCDPHYLTGLDNSGKSCRLKVVESFCRLKDKVFNLFLELKKNRNRDLLANPLKMNLILNFFKLRFTNQEFIKISYLDLIREFRELDSFKEVFTTIAYDLYLAMAVLVFYSQQNFSYMLTIAPKRSSAFYNPAPRSLSIVMDHVLQEEECKSQTIALCMSVLESLKRLTCSDIALNETNVFLVRNFYILII